MVIRNVLLSKGGYFRLQAVKKFLLRRRYAFPNILHPTALPLQLARRDIELHNRRNDCYLGHFDS